MIDSVVFQQTPFGFTLVLAQWPVQCGAVSDFKTEYIASTDGVKVALHDFGGDGPVLVLCHATGFCAHALQPMIECLVDQFHCFALDFRGHGYTRLPPGVEMAWSSLAEDFMAVARHVKPSSGPLLAIGHSMGGASIILGESANPGTVTKIWAFEPIFLPSGPVLRGSDAPDIAQGARRRIATFASAAEVKQRYSTRPPLSVLDERALDAYISHGFDHLEDGSVTLRCRPEVEASVFEHHLAGSYEAAQGVSVSIRAGVGGHADMVVEHIKQVADHNPAVSVVEYKDLTHFGPMEQPARLAADAAEFLAAVG